MIITEYYRTREDGVILNRTSSDSNYMIERDGTQYVEAIDPADLNRVYVETDIIILEENIEENAGEGVEENIEESTENK